MTENPYLATVVTDNKPPPQMRSFSWVAFMIVLLTGQFLYDWSVMDRFFDHSAYVASSMVFRTFLISLAAIAVGKLATRL